MDGICVCAEKYKKVFRIDVDLSSDLLDDNEFRYYEVQNECKVSVLLLKPKQTCIQSFYARRELSSIRPSQQVCVIILFAFAVIFIEFIISYSVGSDFVTVVDHHFRRYCM
jgi:hypothetical protein